MPSVSKKASRICNTSIRRKIANVFPARQVLRYLVVGAGNTLFGYACYAILVAFYSRQLPSRYLPIAVDLASVTATPIGVTVSFLSYKFFVFRTSGNYLREWLRCFLVYGSATIPGLFALPILTKVLYASSIFHNVAPYLAGAIVMGGTAIYTYLAHKSFSFSRSRSEEPTTLIQHETRTVTDQGSG
jgi:putative flippase GtrA